MKRVVAAALLVMTALASRPVTAQRATTGVVRGRVVFVDGDTPVRKARVALTLEGAPASEPIYTDADGRFEFRNVDPGRYMLAAMKTGFAPARFGARSQFDRETLIAVTRGAVVDGLELRLVKSAAITGRIVDADGDPVVGARVSAGRLVRMNGRLQFQAIGAAEEADDLGEYRIGGLAAGSYTVAVSAIGGGMAPRTFFPGTPYLTQARAVPLRAGEVAGATDIVVLPVQGKLVRIAGMVTDAAGLPVPAKVEIITTGDGVSASNTTVTMQVNQTGEFSAGAEPGEHIVIARSESDVAVAYLGSGESDVPDLRLALTAGGRVSGRLVFNGTPPPHTIRVEGWSADLDGIRTSPVTDSFFAGAAVKPDGGFVLDSLIGRREIRVSKIPSGWTVTAITHNGRNLLNVPLEFKGGEDLQGVQIVLTNKPTELSGLVVDRQKRLRPDSSIVVFAEDRTLVPGRARWVRPDHTGRFTVEGLPPGAYLVAAAADVDDVEWATVDYLDRLRSRASRVTLADGEKRAITVEWADAP